MTIDRVDNNTLWNTLEREARELANSEPTLKALLEDSVIRHSSYSSALQHLLLTNLKATSQLASTLPALINEALTKDKTLVSASVADIKAIIERDPACTSSVEAFLFYRGFKALQTYRVAHYFWNQNRRTLARLIQTMIVDSYSMDLHPGARIEAGIFIDHGTGIVIGETARVARNVSMLHNVTLGGTGKTTGIRHPNICEGVMLGAGCKILCNITVGKNSKVAAGSIVLKDVPENTTAVGIPARVIHKPIEEVPAYEMKQEVDEN